MQAAGAFKGEDLSKYTDCIKNIQSSEVTEEM
jgi:hypothetical protein